jgi:hypothetical protein
MHLGSNGRCQGLQCAVGAQQVGQARIAIEARVPMLKVLERRVPLLGVPCREIMGILGNLRTRWLADAPVYACGTCSL